MKIRIVTPAPPGSRHGNRNTALRWAAHLRALGHRVAVETAWQGEEADLLIALHARRSHEAVAAWKKTHPRRPLVLVLTGTDLYRDIRSDPSAQASLALADRLVVLQSMGLHELGRRLQANACVIHQSVRPLKRGKPPAGHFLVTVIGHLREEKDPFRAALALKHLPEDVRVVQLGKALSPAMATQARALMKKDPRYRWLGELPHAGAMRWLARSHAMVISSRMEGGAHVVSEAIAAGVAVLASRISGNVGLLGARYRGYYPFGSQRALAKLMNNAHGDPQFLRSLERAVKARRALVRPATERRALRALIADVSDRKHFAPPKPSRDGR